jgi:predicted transposase/invertase (TIGR01784 family)
MEDNAIGLPHADSDLDLYVVMPDNVNIREIGAMGQQINQVTVANPIKEKDSVDDKLAIMDIVAKADDGRQLTIEIQVANEHNMEKRALYYWSMLFASQMHIGMPCEELKKTIGINILDYRLWKQTKRYHTRFLPLEQSHQSKTFPPGSGEPST